MSIWTQTADVLGQFNPDLPGPAIGGEIRSGMWDGAEVRLRLSGNVTGFETRPEHEARRRDESQRKVRFNKRYNIKKRSH